jgi:hypothetical protein
MRGALLGLCHGLHWPPMLAEEETLQLLHFLSRPVHEREDLASAGDRCKVRDRTSSCCSPHLTKLVNRHHAALPFCDGTGSRHRRFRISAPSCSGAGSRSHAWCVPPVASSQRHARHDSIESARLLLRPPHGRLIRRPLTRSSDKMKRPTHSTAIFHEGFRATFLQLPWSAYHCRCTAHTQLLYGVSLLGSSWSRFLLPHIVHTGPLVLKTVGRTT